MDITRRIKKIEVDKEEEVKGWQKETGKQVLNILSVAYLFNMPTINVK